jgi:hypothetical protein
MERGSAVGVRRRPQSAALGFDDRTTDRQAQAHAAGFGAEEGLKQAFGRLGDETVSGIADGDSYRAGVGRRGANGQFARADFGLLHRFEGVTQQIQHDQLNLDVVGQHRRQRFREFQVQRSINLAQF